jgi:DNA polymerase III alpha subunit
MDLEGNIKTFGVHAAGLVVANGDIRDVCALYERVDAKGTGNELDPSRQHGQVRC